MGRKYLKAYAFLGVLAHPYSDKDALGNCRFCENPGDRFSINIVDGRFRCLDCGESGNLYSFMRKLKHHLNIGSFLPEAVCRKKIKELALERGMSFDSLFLRGQMVFDPLLDRCLLPVEKPLFTVDYEDCHKTSLVNLKKWQMVGGKMRLLGVPGQKPTLYGSDMFTLDLDPDSTEIILCEGEWDALCLLDISLPENWVVLGCPGSDTLCLDQFAPWWKKKGFRNFRFLFDNDRAGRAGTWKGLKALVGLGFSCKYVKMLAWPKGVPEKYDIRDLCDSGLPDDEIVSFLERNSV